uniref:Uncharacterized protein n=1 Tax=Candidatus Kentrum sp. DK TaxID=2126562 RepID=A0A450SWC5_9GAMM|nr:MAG: hypothetical protein BECKDK2373C_GA0170839_106427 [Candidatus Kentron sp. DK]
MSLPVASRYIDEWKKDATMNQYAFTDYFENKVLQKRPYLKREWCIRVCENPIRMEPQEHNRFRFWGE